MSEVERHRPWGEHSKNFAKGETPPMTIESLQDALAEAYTLLDNVVWQVGRTITSDLREQIDAWLEANK